MNGWFIIPFEVDASDHGFLSLKMGDGTVGVPFAVFILAQGVSCIKNPQVASPFIRFFASKKQLPPSSESEKNVTKTEKIFSIRTWGSMH